ncbi:hypothetical protein ACFL2Q_17845 [Thermodesulfobacteriota bacterium]
MSSRKSARRMAMSRFRLLGCHRLLLAGWLVAFDEEEQLASIRKITFMFRCDLQIMRVSFVCSRLITLIPMPLGTRVSEPITNAVNAYFSYAAGSSTAAPWFPFGSGTGITKS